MEGATVRREHRVSKGGNYLNLFIVYAVTGLWHGAAWNSVLWGIWHGFFSIIERITGIHRERRNDLFNAVVRLALVNTWLLAPFVLRATLVEASTYNPFIYFRF